LAQIRGGGYQLRLDVGRPAMHQPVPYGVKILADFMALQPIKESLPSGIMIRQDQFLGGKLMALLIFCLKIAPFYPDPGQFLFQDKRFGFS
jgi:hypothetical protein